MRQMKALGWMHNRLRMITASFLVKDLLIDWREGERYFMQQLIDGDLAANNGGWQWAASTGTDAAPYFRIFNPTTQGERFDEKGILSATICLNWPGCLTAIFTSPMSGQRSIIRNSIIRHQSWIIRWHVKRH